MFSAGVFSLLFLLLTDCAGWQTTWIPPAAVTEEQARFDQEVCGQTAGTAIAPVPGRLSKLLPSIGVGHPPVADRMAAFDACMASKGYRRP